MSEILFKLTPEEVRNTGFKSPMSIDDFKKYSDKYNFANHEHESILAKIGSSALTIAEMTDREKMLSAQGAVLKAIASEFSTEIAAHYQDHIEEEFQKMLNPDD